MIVLIASVNGEFEKLLVDVNSNPPDSRDYYGVASGGGGAKDSFQCYGIGPCVPIQDCGIDYALEAAKKCFDGEKNVFCGVDSQNQPMVCCPKKRRDFETCGRSLVQGRDYKGLGSLPFAVRIGFKSKLDCVKNWLTIFVRLPSITAEFLN